MTLPSTVTDIPTLPSASHDMTWRNLNRFKKNDRGTEFYLECLRYGQHLWLSDLPARAILCFDRAWGADLDGSEDCLKEWPLPYASLVHILKNAPEGAFLGNPRIHFQHYADRLDEPRKEQRSWRAWACWALSCRIRPDLPGDPKHPVEEPTLELIARQLEHHGHPKEYLLWEQIMNEC